VALSLARRDPRIDDLRFIDDASGVAISGEHFGTSGRLEIDGLAIDAQDIQSWTDDRIVFRIAAGRTSGLLRVQTDGGVSNSVFIAVPADMPVVSQEQLVRIESFSPMEITPGGVIRILGFGFGPRSVFAEISFTAAGSDRTVDGMSPWVVHWSNREIRVVVPPGIGSGPLSVAINGETLPETPVGVVIDLPTRAGDTRTRAIHRQVTISGDAATLASGIDVVVPRIPITTGQPAVQLLREEGERLGTVGDDAWIYRAPPPAATEEAQGEAPVVAIHRTDYVERRAIRVEIPDEFPPVETAILETDDVQTAFRALLGPVNGMPPYDPVILQIRDEVVSGYRNPLAIVQRIYQQVPARLEPAPDSDASLKEAILDGRGAAAHYADLAVLLARSSGIPARRHIGVYLDERSRTHRHSWVEFFIPGFGWLPGDPALADGIYRRVPDTGSGESGNTDDTGEAIEGPPLGTLDDRRISLYVDGTPPARFRSGTTRLEPTAPYAPGLQWVELSGEIDPEERENLVVEWVTPEIIPD